MSRLMIKTIDTRQRGDTNGGGSNGLDLPLNAFWSARRIPAAPIAAVHADLFMAALAFYRFQWLYDWTHQLVFDFVLQPHARPAASPQPEPVAPKD